jgi:hypothetical protein
MLCYIQQNRANLANIPASPVNTQKIYLSWILFGEPVSEPVVVPDVLVSVLELVEGRFEDLDGNLFGDVQRNFSIVGSFKRKKINLFQATTSIIFFPVNCRFFIVNKFVLWYLKTIFKKITSIIILQFSTKFSFSSLELGSLSLQELNGG